MSDYKSAALMLDALPRAKALVGDRGYNADWLLQALNAWYHRLYPIEVNRKVPSSHEPPPLSPTPQDRDHVRPPQGLARHPPA